MVFLKIFNEILYIFFIMVVEVRTQNNTRQHNSNRKFFKISRNPTNLRKYLTVTMSLTPKSVIIRSISKQQEKPRLPPPPHDDQETQIIATCCLVNPRCKKRNVNWFYCEKPS